MDDPVIPNRQRPKWGCHFVSVPMARTEFATAIAIEREHRFRICVTHVQRVRFRWDRVGVYFLLIQSDDRGSNCSASQRTVTTYGPLPSNLRFV